MADQAFGAILTDNADLAYDTSNRVFDMRYTSTVSKINARRKGCVGNGVADDTSAMTAALNAAIASNSMLEIPAGTYLVSDGVLNSFTATSQTGLYIRGDCWGGTTLKLADPGVGNTAWFWDNDETAKLERLRCEHVTFLGADDDRCNGFKVWSTGHEKDFKFFDCQFKDLATVMHTWTTSDANGDHMGFTNCAFPNITAQILYLNNAQSVAHSFVNCTHYGPGHFIHTVKGGCVNVVGGSYNFLTGSGADSYVVYAPTGGTIGPGNDGFWFSGVRFEFGAANNMCVYSELGTQHIVFDKCNMFTNLPLVYAGKVGVTIKEIGNVTFRDCHLPDWAYLFDDTATSYFAGGPYILFDGCALPYDVTEKISTTTQVGRVRAMNCVPYSTGPSGATWPATHIKATDFDWNWRATPLGGMTPDPTMRGVLKASWTPWPKSGGNEYTLHLPQTINGGGVRVKSIHFRKPSDGSTTTNNVEYIVGLNDKSEVLARTSAEFRSNEINCDVEVNRVLSEAERLLTVGAYTASLRLWVSTSDTTSVNPGEVWVEYD